MDPGFSNKNHYSPFGQTVSADGGYSLSFAALLVIPVNMQVDMITAQIRILFAEAVISSWLDCYDINHQGGCLASYNTRFWDDASSPLDGTLIHSPLCKGVRGIGVLDNDATRLTMEEYRKASRPLPIAIGVRGEEGSGYSIVRVTEVKRLRMHIEAPNMASYEQTFHLTVHRVGLHIPRAAPGRYEQQQGV